MTPQQLIDMPGYGKAEAWLRENGKWNEETTLDGTKEYKVTVKVTGWYEPGMESQYFDVVASTSDDAKDMAEDLSDFDNIDDCEIIKVMEANE